MRLSLRIEREWIWGAVAVAAMAGLWALDPGGVVGLMREAAFERLGSMLPRTQSSGAVAVVDIDRASLAKIGEWPWRRSVLADLIDKAAAAAPRAIAIDILLSGEDRNGPAALARKLSAMSGAQRIVAAAFQDDDRALAARISAAGNVVLGVVLDDAGTDPSPLPTPLAAEGSTEGIVPRSSAGLLAPLEQLAAGAAGVGVLSFQAGLLGRVTGAPVLAIARGEAFPGFAIEAVRVAEEASLLILKDAPAGVAAGSALVPMDADGEMRLHLGPQENWPARTIPAWRLLEDAGSREALAGKIVVIGSSAPEAGAFLPLAGTALAPTVQIQAEAIDQILASAYLARPQSARWWELFAMAALGLAAVGLAGRLAPGWAAFAALGMILGWIALVALAFRRYGIMLDPIGPAATVLVAAVVTQFAAFVQTRALKTAIVQKFERYVPPEVVARFVREPQSLKLDGELREVTALVTDVESFSRMTETFDPKTLVRVLDAYFDRVTELIVGHGGMVDKIVGDGVLAFFNMPANLPDHPAAAVRCAMAILATTEDFRRRGEAAGLGFGRTRCGIETGMAIVGDVGGARRLDYTAYGVVVNHAARFEKANKTLKSSICVGPVAAGRLGGDIPLRSLGRIEIGGMEGSCQVFEPWSGGASPEMRELYAEAVALYETDAPRAQKLFAELGERLPGDPVIARWHERLAGRA